MLEKLKTKPESWRNAIKYKFGEQRFMMQQND